MPSNNKQDKHAKYPSEPQEAESELSLITKEKNDDLDLIDQKKEQQIINSHSSKATPTPGLLNLPTEMLNQISSFLIAPPRDKDGIDNVLKAVCTHLSGKKNRYATRWAAKAYNKSFLFPLARKDDNHTCALHKKIEPDDMSPYLWNCFGGCFLAIHPISTLCGVPYYANHLVSTLFCGAGFFAGKIKDEYTQPPKKLLSPAQVRERNSSAPEQQVMR